MPKVPIELIEDFSLRARSPGRLEDIVASFLNVGQLSPIRIRRHPTKEGRYLAIYGNRRLAAARKLGWKEIDAEIVKASDVESLTQAFAENEERENFSDYEKALLLHKILVSTRKTHRELAVAVGKSHPYVTQHLAMLDLFPSSVGSEEERAKVSCSLSEREARVLAKIEDPIQRWNTAKFAVASNLCYREIERFVTNPSIKGKEKQRSNHEIEGFILDLVSRVNLGDLSEWFKAKSLRKYSIFNDFPPMNRLTRQDAIERELTIAKQVDEITLKPYEIDVQVSGNLAFATMYVHYLIKASGNNTRIVSRVTMVFQKEADLWRIIHEHWSLANLQELAIFTKLQMPITQTNLARD